VERVWEGDVTPDVIRAWGYDEDLVLLEQDEDLVLSRYEFVPALLELAGDDHCPKQEWAFFILCHFSRRAVTRGGGRDVAALRAAWSTVPEPANGRPRDWHQFVGRLLSYTEPSGPVDAQAARRMAVELLLGIAGRVGNVVDCDSLRPGWRRYCLRTSLTEYIDVCEATGIFSYTQYY
jgi:hypothetical protein